MHRSEHWWRRPSWPRPSSSRPRLPWRPVVAAPYTLTNSASGNAVAIFDRASDGSLTPDRTVPTGGNGTGAGLGSQGALVLDGNRLFAVNAGSHTISLLRVGHRGNVWLQDTAPAGGVGPISITVHGKLVYVVNQGDATTAANIKGFLALWGRLVPLPGSGRPLSTAAPEPAQIEFSPNGRHLVVTEKATNTISTYRVEPSATRAARTPSPSAGETPFGFAFDKRGRLIVSEAFGGAPDASVLSSYSSRPTVRSRRSRRTWPRPRRPRAGSS